MKRREFLGTLTGPVVVACAVCMGACSKSAGGSNGGSGGGPGPGGGGGVSANFTVDLGTSLLTVGSSLVQNGVIVARLAAGNTAASFTAVQVACTHEGTAINFNPSGNNFVCPNHGSVFTSSGTVTTGPAINSLKQYTITVSGNVMTVTG